MGDSKGKRQWRFKEVWYLSKRTDLVGQFLEEVKSDDTDDLRSSKESKTIPTEILDCST